jgi:hypothetical protein
MKGVKKYDLPQKICEKCGKPFSWRKKWEKVWQEVKYCSDKCNFGTGVACRLASPLERAFRRSLNSVGSPGLSALDFHTEQSYAGSSASSQALLLRLFEMLLLVCSHIYSIIVRV